MFPEGHTLPVLNGVITYLWLRGGDGGFREIKIQREENRSVERTGGERERTVTLD